MPPIATEGGPADFDVEGWAGLMVPAGTPAPIIERLATEVQAGFATSRLREQFLAMGAEVDGRGPAAFATMLRQHSSSFAAVIGRLGVRLE